MYISYFGLNQSPFRTAPDPEYFFASGLHLRAVDRVVHAIRERAGLVLVLGEIGQGKTTVCRYVQTRYRDEFLIGYLGNPFLDVQEFGRQILLEFGLSGEVTGSGDIVRMLTAFLREQDRTGRVVVLFLDEAHLLSPDVLEFLLIVTNIQHRGRHLLQMVLAGQNEFQETLRQPRFSSLNQRLGNRIVVADLDKDDVAAYIRFRLDQAGGSGRDLFAPAAVTRIWKVTRGNPRLINQVCERLLEGAYERRVGSIGPKDVNQLCKNPVFAPILFPDMQTSRTILWGPVLAALVLVFVSVGIGTRVLDDQPPVAVTLPEATLPMTTAANASFVTPETATPGMGKRSDPIVMAGVDNGTVAPQLAVPDEVSGASFSERDDVATISLPESVDTGGNGTHAGVEEQLKKILELLAARESAPEIPANQDMSTSVVEMKAEDPASHVSPQAEQSGQGKPFQAGATDTVVAEKEQAEVTSRVRSVEPEIRKISLSPAPGIEVNAIVWDPLPRFRLAVVNERIVKQGASVGDGYTVEAILKESIRISLAGRMFENRVHGKK